MDGIQSWLHEVLGNLHVTIPTVGSRYKSDKKP
jgi:hypothetical protein